MKIIADLKAVSNGSFIKGLANIFFNASFHALLNYRIASFFYKLHLTIISKMLMYINRVLFSVDIDYRAELAGGFCLVHGVGVVIGCNVRTDGPVKVYQNVTIGGDGKSRCENGTTFTQPWLKEGCAIYSHSVIIGPVIINENAIVGAGTIVKSDVPANTMVYTKTEKVYRNLIT